MVGDPPWMGAMPEVRRGRAGYSRAAQRRWIGPATRSLADDDAPVLAHHVAGLAVASGADAAARSVGFEPSTELQPRGKEPDRGPTLDAPCPARAVVPVLAGDGANAERLMASPLRATP